MKGGARPPFFRHVEHLSDCGKTGVNLNPPRPDCGRNRSGTALERGFRGLCGVVSAVPTLSGVRPSGVGAASHRGGPSGPVRPVGPARPSGLRPAQGAALGGCAPGPPLSLRGPRLRGPVRGRVATLAALLGTVMARVSRRGSGAPLGLGPDGPGLALSVIKENPLSHPLRGCQLSQRVTDRRSSGLRPWRAQGALEARQPNCYSRI